MSSPKKSPIEFITNWWEQKKTEEPPWHLLASIGSILLLAQVFTHGDVQLVAFAALVIFLVLMGDWWKTRDGQLQELTMEPFKRFLRDKADANGNCYFSIEELRSVLGVDNLPPDYRDLPVRTYVYRINHNNTITYGSCPFGSLRAELALRPYILAKADHNGRFAATVDYLQRVLGYSVLPHDVSAKNGDAIVYRTGHGHNYGVCQPHALPSELEPLVMT